MDAEKYIFIMPKLCKRQIYVNTYTNANNNHVDKNKSNVLL